MEKILTKMSEPIFEGVENNPLKTVLEYITFLTKHDHPLKKYLFRYGKEWKEIEMELKIKHYDKKPPKIKEIHEIPIAVTTMGELVCVPDLLEPIKASCYGHTGTGKTLLLHRFVDELYHHHNYLIGIINDYMKETVDWTYPMSHKNFVKKIMLIRETPNPLPIISILPSTAYNIALPVSMPYLKTKIPFKEIIKNFSTFCELGASYKYFKGLNLSESQSYEDIEKEIEKMVVDKQNRSGKASANKIYSEIKRLFKAGITSFDKEIVSELVLNYGQPDEPFIQLLKTGVIPSIITEGFIHSEEFTYYMKYLIDNIISHQESDPWFSNKRVLLAIEELNQVISLPKKVGFPRSGAVESIKNMAQRGRFLRTGMIFCAQNRHKIDDEIASNCNYCFCFMMKSSDDVGKIRGDWQLSRGEEKEITTLEKYECLGLTTEHFVIYDLLGNRKYKSKTFKGMVIPPLSYHSPRSGSKRIGIRQGGWVSASYYATQILLKRGIIVRNNETQNRILRSQAHKMYAEDIQKPAIIDKVNLSKAFYQKEFRQRIMSYEELLRFGLVIVKRPIKFGEKMYSRQNYVYEVVYKYNVGGKMIPQTNQPKDIEMIIFNPKGRNIRLYGKDCLPINYEVG